MRKNKDDRPVVLIKCRRGHDMATRGQECSSMQAHNMSVPGDSVARFECAECGYVWTVPVGGCMHLPPGV